ncbi:MAG: hypothetical protein KIT25_06485 [Enhydrobacter sp.]|nr:MAG: hypothetical protein KIT25_06485 [Enhydrobacter sp.]
MNRLTLFKRVCMALWGPQYRSEGARQLDISLRTMMRYDAGESPVPEEIMDKLTSILERRTREINELTDRMEREMRVG